MDLGAARSVWYDREANIFPSTLLEERFFLASLLECMQLFASLVFRSRKQANYAKYYGGERLRTC